MSTKLRMLKILEILKETDEYHPITATKISKILLEQGFKCENKAILRDINLLREEYDIINCVDNKKGCYLGERNYEDWEIKVLVDSVYNSKFLSVDDKRLLTGKLLKEVSGNSQKNMKKAFIEGRVRNPSKYNIDKLMSAINQNKKIKIQYLKHEEKEYLLNPYDLVLKNESYYLLCNVDKYDNFSYFRVDKITKVTTIDENRKLEILGENPDITLHEFAKTSLYAYSGETIKLHLEFKESHSSNIYDYFGFDTKIETKDGVSKAVIDVSDSDGLYFWLLQNSNNIKVLYPSSVSERLVLEAKKIVDLYKK